MSAQFPATSSAKTVFRAFDPYSPQQCRETAESLSAINSLSRASRWQFPQFEQALRENSLKTFVAEFDSTIVAFAILSVVPPEAHLVNIAVAPVFQRKGVGKNLLTFAFSDLAEKRIDECWLEVRLANLDAQRFYRRFGFEERMRRFGFYEAPKDDAILMSANLAHYRARKFA